MEEFDYCPGKNYATGTCIFSILIDHRSTCTKFDILINLCGLMNRILLPDNIERCRKINHKFVKNIVDLLEKIQEHFLNSRKAVQIQISGHKSIENII